MENFEAEVIFESSIGIDPFNYLVIYGRHINGYFCAIPNWGVSCEMSDPDDVYYNSRTLATVKTPYAAAEEISKKIQLICRQIGFEHKPQDPLKKLGLKSNA